MVLPSGLSLWGWPVFHPWNCQTLVLDRLAQGMGKHQLGEGRGEGGWGPKEEGCSVGLREVLAQEARPNLTGWAGVEKRCGLWGRGGWGCLGRRAPALKRVPENRAAMRGRLQL